MLGAMKNTFFRNLFFSFFLLMSILLLIFSAAIFGQWEKAQKERERQESSNQAAMAIRIIDEKFSSMDLIAAQIASSSWLKYVSARSDILYSRVDYLRKKEISQTIGNQNDSLRIAKSTGVILPYRNLAIDKISFWEVEQYFDSLGLDRDTLNEIRGELEGKYGSLVLYADETLQKDNSSFAVVRQLEYGQNVNKLLFIYVDGRQFESFLKSSGSNIAGLEIIYDGTVIYSLGMTGHDEGRYQEKMESPLHNWSYTVTLNNSGYRAERSGILLWLTAFFFGVTVLEFAVAWELARFSVRPVQQLMVKLGIHRSDAPMLDAIENSWQDMKMQKEWMESLGNQYYQIAESGYLSSLLFGTYESELVENHAKEFHLPLREPMVCQALLLGYQGDSAKHFRDACLEISLQCYRDGVPAIFCKEESVLILKAEKRETLIRQEELVRKMLDEMFPDLELELHSGGIHQGFEGISRSYREGKKKADRVQGKENMYYYPLELELKLIHFMKMGNFTEAEALLALIREENEGRQLLDGEKNRVIRLISEMFRRFCEDSGLEPGGFDSNFSDETDWNALFDLLSRIQEGYGENGLNNKLGKKLVKYVDENYANSELSQQDIADLFGISRPMVSKLFKEAAHMNFIEYLHRKRVEQAKYLFHSGEKDAALVGKQVGYENEVTFKRAFVKYEGVTPREYMKMSR